MSTLPKWDTEREETLKKAVGKEAPVSASTVESAAATLGTTTRSVASKLRKMGYEVASMSKEVTKSYTDSEEAELKSFLESNPNKYTYADLAGLVLDGSRTAKQLQGKILSMELTSLVKPTPKVEKQKTYTEEEEAKILSMVRNGDFIEDIADALGRNVPSIRGKILSLSRENPDITIPKQRVYVSKDKEDPIEALGDVSEMTVEEIAESIDKSVRGVKTMLTHRGVSCKNYNGAKKAEKIAEAKKAS